LQFEIKCLSKINLYVNMKTLHLIIFIATLAFFASCGSENPDKSKKKGDIDDLLTNTAADPNLDQFRQDFYKAKQIIYSLPSPIETAMLIRRSQVSFKENLLNKRENASRYTTTLQKALNLGVYGADLSYASMFDQTQIAVQYMSVSMKLADELGILGAIDDAIIKRIENNIQNRDSLMDIITETFMNSDSYLKENKRPETAALILAGGWLEGLYLAIQSISTNNKPDNEYLIDRVIDQKISLNSLINLLETYHNIEMVNKVLMDMKKIEQVYDRFEIVYAQIETLTDHDDNTTIIKARSEVFKSAHALKSLYHVVDSLRNNYIAYN